MVRDQRTMHRKREGRSRLAVEKEKSPPKREKPATRRRLQKKNKILDRTRSEETKGKEERR